MNKRYWNKKILLFVFYWTHRLENNTILWKWTQNIKKIVGSELVLRPINLIIIIIYRKLFSKFPVSLDLADTVTQYYIVARTYQCLIIVM